MDTWGQLLDLIDDHIDDEKNDYSMVYNLEEETRANGAIPGPRR